MNWLSKIPPNLRLALLLLVGALIGIPIQSALSGGSGQDSAKSAVWYCSGCSTKPPVVPTPPSGTGGNAGTGGAAATGGAAPVAVQFPQCNPGQTFRAPNPDSIQKWRKSLPPRHKIREQGVFLLAPTVAINPVGWDSNDPWCGNQKSIGACEAFTQLDIATAKPRTLSFATQDAFNSAALSAYTWITQNDPFPGAWPPNDTGSDSMSGCKWLVKNGYAKGCQVLTGISSVKTAIQSGPVITGMNWRANMYTPDRCGNLDTDGNIDGGHAASIKYFNTSPELWYLENHWDNDWGICKGTHCGYFVLTSSQLFGTALDADFVQPVQ